MSHVKGTGWVFFHIKVSTVQAIGQHFIQDFIHDIDCMKKRIDKNGTYT